MIENEKKQGNWWKPAVEIFTQISGWIVGPIVVALVFGKMLDNHYDTKPIIFLVFVGISFLITCVGMVKVVRKYMKQIKDFSPDVKSGSRPESVGTEKK